MNVKVWYINVVAGYGIDCGSAIFYTPVEEAEALSLKPYFVAEYFPLSKTHKLVSTDPKSQVAFSLMEDVLHSLPLIQDKNRSKLGER
ncbi:MAG: hypothetical protein A2901_07740 [Elusimicrobia bacterium RIFCSPLOWO2_01_FULL_54_10]|nr:MAG: hypothetical protein A2901_07740 [Elusimicrobia bacterium RIFCSPLOWO2_01_FULL_54_10]